MPSRGFYQVTSQEEGKAVQRDQSYRSCVFTLLIFFFLCIILILAAIPWKKSHHYSEDPDDNLRAMQQRHREHPTERTTTTTERLLHNRNTEDILESTTLEFETFTEEFNNSSEFEKFVKADATTEPESTGTTVEQLHEDSSTININPLLQSFTLSTEKDITDSTPEENSQTNFDHSEVYTFQSSISTDSNYASETVSEYVTYEPRIEDEKSTTINNTFGATVFDDDYEPTTENIIEPRIINEEATSTDNNLDTTEMNTENIMEPKIENEESTRTDNSLETIEITTENIIGFTKENEETSSTDNSLETTEINTEDIVEFTTTDDTKSMNEEVLFEDKSTTQSTTEATNKNKQNTTENPEDSTTYPTTSTTSRSMITTSVDRSKRQVCTTGECKNMASKMLFYMNHTADPCEDFYEYACGGFEANPQIVERSLKNAAYQRILRQMQRETDVGEPSLFAKYYNSCMRYENIEQTERIRLAKRALNGVGKFYTSDNEARNHTNFTKLIANLLLHNSALLFNIVPTLDEFSPGITFKIGPATDRSPFDTEETRDPCHASRRDREDQNVDLGELYKEYKTCKDDTRKFLASISEALTALGVFNELNNTYITQYINITVFNIDVEIVKTFFANFPTEDQIREAYVTKNYTRVKVADLQGATKIVNWTNLIYSLMREQVLPEGHIQVYFYDALIQGLKSLEDFGARSPMQLNNALLGLYAHDIYRELVLSRHKNLEDHCLRVAANILIPEASNLYISSFSSDEFSYMNRTIRSLFESLKETLKSKVREAEWAADEGRDALATKIDDLKIAVPDISYFTDDCSTYRRIKADQVNLTDNYFDNSMVLIKRYRTLMYREFVTNPGDPEQIWTQYATPYQSKGLVIYRLNLVVIPFGVIDWSTMRDESSFDYVALATLGTVIARQIAHHFDANGIYYWNGTRDAEYSLLNDNDSTNSNFKDYINCQRNILYQNPTITELPSTGQTVSYQITQLTLNERLSEIMGLRLAYDTFYRLRSRGEANLPWLELHSDQLFYLTYAQTYCTKAPLTSSYVSLYENEQLPSRVRIFVAASNNRLLGEAWKCPEGSRIIPSSTCAVFPYLETKDETGVAVSRK